MPVSMRADGQGDAEGPLPHLRPDALAAAAWEPFGWLVEPETEQIDPRHRLQFLWDDVHLDLISHRHDEVPRRADGYVCERLYRHETHTQALMALDADAVITVAPESTSFDSAEDNGALRCFLLHPLEAVVMHRGTWHWGPFPVGSERVTLLNLQGHRYREDNACMDLAGRGLAMLVDLT